MTQPAAPQNRYDRVDLKGVVGWVYEVRNLEPLVKRDAIATGLELGVQLRGEWSQTGRRTGARTYRPGEVHVLSPGEAYELSCSATRYETGLQVGFIVYPDEVQGFAPSDAAVAFRPSVELDARFHELCRAQVDAVDRGAPLPSAQVRSEVLRWVTHNVEIAPADPLVAARRLLEQSFAQPLYLKHIADHAGMRSPVVFSRNFARRFGVTPIAYRVKLRLNEAARLTWARPDLTVAEIGAMVGFEDERYFHRAFVTQHGVSPATYGRRMATGRSGAADPSDPPLRAKVCA